MVRAKAYFEDLMYGRKRSLFGNGFLSALSLVYGLVVSLRQALYRLRILKTNELPCRVISVGNLTLGGTGKTPMVISISELLLKKQRRPMVVSRGYGRKNASAMLVVSDGHSLLVDSRHGGDEPFLIASKLPGVPVVVGPDRYQAARSVLKRFNPDTVVLDDGFQHIQLRRALDVVLVDALDPFGNGKLFPAGILREPLTALKRAHAVVITRADQSEGAGRLKAIIREKTGARLFTSRLAPLDMVEGRTGTVRPLSSLARARVLALAGIARPASFVSLLKSLGAAVAAECVYPDHYVFEKSDLAEVYKKAADEKVDIIITTEKDAVRLNNFNADGIWALRVEQRILETEDWERMLLEQPA